MSKRSNALKLAEEFQKHCFENKYSIQDAILATAIQAKIFEKLKPELWDAAFKDADLGLSLAVPQTDN